MGNMIPLSEIEVESNRKYTGDEGFEQLVNSIRKIGMIEPPVVRHMPGGTYRIVAGRRRIEALRKINKESGGELYNQVACVVMEKHYAFSDEEIALAENVNRQEMHPLDEAAHFSVLAERGMAIGEIARYYARSPSAIYKRLRLAGLIEELKGTFRDGKMNIAQAAVLAELPEENQKDFFEQYREKEKIESSWISSFIYKNQKFSVSECMVSECEGCEKRTHNRGNELFDEFGYVGDVCFDVDCYLRTWRKIIAEELEEKIAKAPDRGSINKIYFSEGEPKRIYKKATHVTFDIFNAIIGKKEDVKFEVLLEKDCMFTDGETGRAKDVCWEVGETYEGEIKVKRIGYKKRPPKEESVAADSGGKKNLKKLVENYGREEVEAAAPDRGVAPEELAEALDKNKTMNSYTFNYEIEKLVYERVTAKRMEQPPADYFSMFLGMLEGEMMLSETSYVEKNFSGRQKEWWKKLLGSKSLGQIAKDLSGEMQKVFHFLLISSEVLERDIPYIETQNKQDSLFWKYAGLSEKEYRALWMEAAKDVAAEVLEPKEKKGAKKKG